MDSGSIVPGRITHLAGPSSSGKTTVTKALEAQGWLRMEADAERNTVQVNFLKKELFDKLSFIESHLHEGFSSRDLMTVVYGDKPPVKAPRDTAHFEKVRQELLAFVETRAEEINQALLIHMLDTAQKLAKKGKNVILDDVPLLNERERSHEVTQDLESPNLWCFRDVKIEQQLKFVPLAILMRNLIHRNVNPEDHRNIPRVLIEQYSTRFVAATRPDQESLGELEVATLTKWVERAVKMDFFDFAPGHALVHDSNEEIDIAIERRLDGFMALQEKDVGPADRETVRRRQAEYPNLQEKIATTTQTILHNMGIPEGATKVTLTFAASSNIKPAIIRDSQ